MVPMRQILPWSGPKAAPISMPKSATSRWRTRSSSTPSGTITGVMNGSRCSGGSGAEEREPERGRGPRAGVAMEPMAREARGQPFLVDRAQGLAQAVDHRRRRGVVVEARGLQ